MNTTVDEAISLVDHMRESLAPLTSRVEIVLCPPFVSLAAVKERVAGTALQVGAQNLYPQDKGAFTGEVSPIMLAPLCRYVIVGHSERRHYFKETDAFINQKVRAALAHGLIPIICVGETLSEYEAGQTDTVVRSQVNGVLAGLTPEQVRGVVIAYEPVWAIGTGKAATGEGAQRVIAMIRHLLREIAGQEIAETVRIQYGGSVTAANIAEFIHQPDIDGALVGGASLKPAEFIGIVRQTAEVKGRAS